MNQATEKGNGIDLRPEWGIFIPSVLVIILISIPAVLYPKAAEEVVSAIYQPFAANFGTLYLWITVGLIILCVYFACSRYGDIKFGDPDEKPEFSLSSWIAMIFCSGVAGAVMFWSIIEPLWDIVQPPQYAAPMSTQAYDWALAYLLLHWGPNAWCTYFITALPIAYMFHIRRKPFLRISSAADMIIGKQKDGLLGRCVDVFFILGLLFCTAVTMCISLPTVEAALARVFGITPSFGLEIAILFVSALLAGVTVYLGLKKGIKRLSDINVVIALAMVAYGALVGPTSSLFDIFTNAVGKMLGNFWSMTFWTNPFSEGSFPRDWTIFYALFWAGYGPFMGLFIARISRGRTVREVIGWGMFGTVAGGFMTWNWIFFVNVPVGAVCLVALRIPMAGRETATAKNPIDTVGLILLIIGVGCLQLMLDEGKDKDWFASGYIVILGVLTVVGLVLLVAWELTEEHPVVDLSLFRHRNFTVGTICISLGFLFYFAGVVMMPMMLQTRLGYTSMWAGLSLAPIGIFPVFLSPLIGRFAQRIDMRVIVTMSFLVFSAAFYLRTLFSPDVDFAFVLWPQVVQGIGVAMFFMPLTSIIISGLDAKDIANASSLSNCTRVLAGSIGSSLATTMWERQEALHHVRLTESINPFNPAAQHGLNQLTQMGLSPEQAKVWVANEITRQGFLLGFNELFWLASIAFIGLAGLVWLSTPINKKIR